MKRVLIGVSLITSFAVLPVTVQAASPPQAGAIQRVPVWNLVGNYIVNFDCATCVPHNITIRAYDPYTGSFWGDGIYAVNPSYTWSINGQLNGNVVSFRILYTGVQAGYSVMATGTIAPDGSMAGTAVDASGSRFGWTITSGVAVSYANHGQFVSAQANKQMAAQSNFGMPLQQGN